MVPPDTSLQACGPDANGGRRVMAVWLRSGHPIEAQPVRPNSERIAPPHAWTMLGTDRYPWYPQARCFTSTYVVMTSMSRSSSAVTSRRGETIS